MLQAARAALSLPAISFGLSLTHISLSENTKKASTSSQFCRGMQAPIGTSPISRFGARGAPGGENRGDVPEKPASQAQTGPVRHPENRPIKGSMCYHPQVIVRGHREKFWTVWTTSRRTSRPRALQASDRASDRAPLVSVLPDHIAIAGIRRDAEDAEAEALDAASRPYLPTTKLSTTRTSSV